MWYPYGLFAHCWCPVKAEPIFYTPIGDKKMIDEKEFKEDDKQIVDATQDMQREIQEHKESMEIYKTEFAKLLGLEEKKYSIELKLYLVDIILYDYPIKELPKIIDELQKISDSISIFLEADGINISASLKKLKDD